MAKLIGQRQLTKRFHIEVFDDGVINVVKTTNGQVISLDEPLFLLRARDKLAVPLLQRYRQLIAETDYPNSVAKAEHLDSNYNTIEEFQEFAYKHPDKMKLPNVTRGK